MVLCFRNHGTASKRKKTVLKYEVNREKRIKARSKRRMTVFTRGHELCYVAGGDIFIRYKDEYGMIWTYASTDELWEDYKTRGLHLKDSAKEARCKVDDALYTYEDDELDVSVHQPQSPSTDSLSTIPAAPGNLQIESTPNPRPRVNKTFSLPQTMNSIGENLDVSQISSESNTVSSSLNDVDAVDISGIVSFINNPIETEETSSMTIEGEYLFNK